MSFPGSFSGTIVGSYPGGGPFAEELPKWLEEYGFADFNYAESGALTFRYSKYKVWAFSFNAINRGEITTLCVGDVISLHYGMRLRRFSWQENFLIIISIPQNLSQLMQLFSHNLHLRASAFDLLLAYLIIWLVLRAVTLLRQKKEFNSWLRSVLQEMHNQAGEQRAA